MMNSQSSKHEEERAYKFIQEKAITLANNPVLVLNPEVVFVDFLGEILVCLRVEKEPIIEEDIELSLCVEEELLPRPPMMIECWIAIFKGLASLNESLNAELSNKYKEYSLHLKKLIYFDRTYERNGYHEELIPKFIQWYKDQTLAGLTEPDPSRIFDQIVDGLKYDKVSVEKDKKDDTPLFFTFTFFHDDNPTHLNLNYLRMLIKHGQFTVKNHNGHSFLEIQVRVKVLK